MLSGKITSCFQIVAAHAVKVHVTQGLNAHISGYLPIHCIYHLLKTRAFSKHKVNIKVHYFSQCHEIYVRIS